MSYHLQSRLQPQRCWIIHYISLWMAVERKHTSAWRGPRRRLIQITNRSRAQRCLRQWRNVFLGALIIARRTEAGTDRASCSCNLTRKRAIDMLVFAAIWLSNFWPAQQLTPRFVFWELSCEMQRSYRGSWISTSYSPWMSSNCWGCRAQMQKYAN